MLQINRNSDFKMLEKFNSSLSELRFVYKYYTTAFDGYEVSYDGQSWKNCHQVDDTTICVIFDKPGFSVGKLKCERKIYLSDDDYNDGICTIASNDITEVIITSNRTNPMPPFESQFVPAYFKGDPGDNAYELAIRNGYDGTLEQWLESIKGKPGESADPEELAHLQKQLSASKTAIEELQQELFPLTLNMSISGTLFEVGTTQSLTISWSAYRKGLGVRPDKLALNGNDVSVNGTSGSINVTGVNKDTTYTLIAEYNGMSVTKSISVKFVNRSYRGIVDTPTPSAVQVAALTSWINSSKAYTWSGISMSMSRTCYAYPKSFGLLSSITDGTDSYMSSYTRRELAINGVAYYVYTLNDAVTTKSLTQKFN